jgi:Na+/glutamate symporter
MLAELLREAWTSPFYVKGNYARQNALEVAAAASMGLITTEVSTGSFGGQWLITREGLEVLHEHKHS